MMSYHPVTRQIVQIIREKGLWHETFEHEPVVTSEDAAKVRTGYTLSQGAKALIVSYKPQAASIQNYVMLVLPGDKKLDNKKVKTTLGVKSYSFADPDELVRVTGGVERGGVPPWGTLFGIPVYVDKSLFDNEKIIFNAGDRRFSVAMRGEDYQNIVNPQIVSLVAQV